MKKIETVEIKEKKNKRNRFVVGVILIFLMLFSTAGYAFFSSGGRNKQDSSGDEIGNGQYVNGLWVYQIEDQEFGFTNYVDLAGKVEIEGDVSLNRFYNQPLFIDSDPISATEISRNIGRYTSRIQEACYGGCDEDLPEKDCSENLIVVRESEDDRVYTDENCVFIEGDLVAVDAFLYRSLGFI